MSRLPKDIQQLVDKLEPLMQRAFLEAINNVRSRAQLGLITEAIRAGNITQALELLSIDPRLLQPLDRIISQAYFEGGVAALASLPRMSDPFNGRTVVLGFDGRHVRAESWVKEVAGTLIEGIRSDSITAVRNVLLNGVENGIAPRTIALDITGRINKLTGRREGGILGLNSNQADAAMRARAELLSGDPQQMKNYLTRRRRDANLDGFVKRAITDGRPLTGAEADRLTMRYKDRLLAYRGEVIARTEMLDAVRAGRHEGFEQLVETGAVRDDQVVREWKAAGDERTRDSHERMHSQKVRGMATPFVGQGANGPWEALYPGDTSLGAPPAETIQCRCYEHVRIEYIKKRAAYDW